MLSSRRAISRFTRQLNFSSIATTEEFPVKVSLTPISPWPAVLSSLKTDSGITLVTRDVYSPIVTLNFSILGGSSTESLKQKGAANLLANAAFAGNKDSSGLLVVRYLEFLGTKFSATSDKNKISYHVSVQADLVEPVVRCILSNIATPPAATYVYDDIKSSLKFHYDAYAKDYTAQILQLIDEAAYGEVSPKGSSIYASNLKKLTSDDVVEYRTSHFTRKNLVITANGISSDQLQPIVNNLSGVIIEGSPVVSPASPYVGGEVKIRTDLNGKTYTSLAFPVPTGTSESAKPFRVLEGLLAAKLKANKIPAKSFFKDGSLIGVAFSGTPEKVSSTLELVLSELKAIANGGHNEGVNIIKNKLTVSNFLELDGSKSVDQLLSAYMNGSEVSQVADLRSVSPESVSSAAQTVIKSVPSYAILGTTAGTPSYADVLKLTGNN
eukprot:gene4996-6981_t